MTSAIARIAAFEESLESAIKAALDVCEIRVSDEAADELKINIFGRAVLPSDPQNYQMTLLEVVVIRDTLGDCEYPSAINTTLGFVPDRDLEKSLISEVVATLANEADCRQKAESLEVSGVVQGRGKALAQEGGSSLAPQEPGRSPSP